MAAARWGGAAFLLWYGLQALLRALAVTLLNPHVYLDMVLLIGR